jgi:hypothetical protein
LRSHANAHSGPHSRADAEYRADEVAGEVAAAQLLSDDGRLTERRADQWMFELRVCCRVNPSTVVNTRRRGNNEKNPVVVGNDRSEIAALIL